MTKLGRIKHVGLFTQLRLPLQTELAKGVQYSTFLLRNSGIFNDVLLLELSPPPSTF